MMVLAAFLDLHMNEESVLGDGDREMARFRMTGTHRGEFIGLPASGRRLDIQGFDEIRTVGGRASEPGRDGPHANDAAVRGDAEGAPAG